MKGSFVFSHEDPEVCLLGNISLELNSILFQIQSYALEKLVNQDNIFFFFFLLIPKEEKFPQIHSKNTVFYLHRGRKYISKMIQRSKTMFFVVINLTEYVLLISYCTSVYDLNTKSFSNTGLKMEDT